MAIVEPAKLGTSLGDYSLTGEVDVENTGDVGVVVRVKVAWPQHGTAPVKAFNPEDDITYPMVLEGSKGNECFGPSYSGVTAGTSVIVKDDDGKTLGVGKLGTGSGKTIEGLLDCRFPFAFESDKPDTKFFTIQVGEGVTFKTERLGKKLELGGRPAGGGAPSLGTVAVWLTRPSGRSTASILSTRTGTSS